MAGEVGAAGGRSTFEIPVMGGALGGSGLWGKLSHWGKLSPVLPRAPVDENLSMSSSGDPMLPPGRCFGGSVSILEWSRLGEMLLAGNLGSNLSSVLAFVVSLANHLSLSFLSVEWMVIVIPAGLTKKCRLSGAWRGVSVHEQRQC